MLKSNTEKKAIYAEELSAFKGLKLSNVKEKVTSILSLIGNNGIFGEYTKHDISHIDNMLDLLDIIIPDTTKDKMTASEWMMITLAIYFHDLGMLVTNDEFKNRYDSGFKNFRDNYIERKFKSEENGLVVTGHNEVEFEKYLYQEFVRANHAERIKYWILDEGSISYPEGIAVIQEIRSLLTNVNYAFRRDLASICESHHLSDLDDHDKYKPNQQYGNKNDEIVNLHYIALLLRTADLLHITSDRTPTIEFSLINPQDPISQEEWCKQKAVRTIRAKAKQNKDGIFDKNIQSDTLEVIADFIDEKGFFGLISYLNYADKELKENYKFNEKVKKIYNTEYEYPWRNIDDSSIETKNFERKQFEFVLDQTKILDLLVGHTLYNDSTVVLRELIQNAIDATKLQNYIYLNSTKPTIYNKKIDINWNESSRILTIADNGTGMTLDIIENHLLKVGSSRYQDNDFIKKYPDFSPISRFGIGLLTCFLIADDIDIITKSYESDKYILVKIKKLHGKYLLKYLSKSEVPVEIHEHGTIIKLNVREDVDLTNLQSNINKWIVIPECNLTYTKEDESSKIGYDTLKDTLVDFMELNGFPVDNKKYKVVEADTDGLKMAYALKYSELWQEWNYMHVDEFSNHSTNPIGTCIEGIRVDFSTPGFSGSTIVAISNAYGTKSPKTNVARSNIEDTKERINMIKSIYKVYLKHIDEQLLNLVEKDFSLTWAASESNYQMRHFLDDRKSRNEFLLEPLLFENAYEELNCLVLEKGESRGLSSIKSLKEIGGFWTINSSSYNSADSFIKQSKTSNSSALKLLNIILGEEKSHIKHIDGLFCQRHSNVIANKLLKSSFQIEAIRIIPEQNRVDLKWKFDSNIKWKMVELVDDNFYRHAAQMFCFFQLEDIEYSPSTIEASTIITSDEVIILKNSKLYNYIVHDVKLSNFDSYDEELVLNTILSIIYGLYSYRDVDIEIIDREIDNYVGRFYRESEKIFWEKVDRSKLVNLLLKNEFVKYDTTVWERRTTF